MTQICSRMAINIKNRTIVAYLAVVYTLIQSGSVYQYAYMDTLGKVHILVTMLIAFYHFLQKGKKISVIRRDIGDIFVICGGLGLLLCMILWGEYSSIWGYIGKICKILMPWLICQYIQMDDFLDAYIRIIFFLALTSLIAFLFPTILNIFPFKFLIETPQWSFDNYLIYAAYHNPIYAIHQRNVGVFWEPGMYQGFLIFAMLYVATTKTWNVKTAMYQLVMGATILTTQSSTGYILLLMVILVILMTVVSPTKKVLRVLMTMGIIILTLILALTPQLIMNLVDCFVPGSSAKFALDNSSSSMGTRFYGTLIDAILVLKNPFGIGETQIDAYRSSVAMQYNFVVSGANINTTFAMMLYYGWIPGIIYSILMVKGCFRFFGKNIIAVISLLSFIIIINTEPHYMTVFFTIIFMYCARYNQGGVPFKREYSHCSQIKTSYNAK